MNSLTAFIRRAALVAAALSSLVAVQDAVAAGTVANTTISNTATVNYTVGGVAQTPITSNTSTFLVDRKVNLNVTAGTAPPPRPASPTRA